MISEKILKLAECIKKCTDYDHSFPKVDNFYVTIYDPYAIRAADSPEPDENQQYYIEYFNWYSSPFEHDRNHIDIVNKEEFFYVLDTINDFIKRYKSSKV